MRYLEVAIILINHQAKLTCVTAGKSLLVVTTMKGFETLD